MRIAAIDIGSNTSLLLIVEQGQKGFQILSDKIYFTRLAEGMGLREDFSEKALLRLSEAFSSISYELKKWKVDKISIVATWACRQVKNKNRLHELSRTYHLPPIQIISPEKEAELSFNGAFFGLSSRFFNPLVIDIGGGSTEIVSAKKSYSLNIGSVFLTEKFLGTEALSPEDHKKLIRHIHFVLEAVGDFLRQDYDHIIFVAGIPITLAFMEYNTSDIDQIHGQILKDSQLKFWLDKLADLSVEERKKIPHLPEYRADVIISGLLVLYEILKRTGKKEFVISSTGLRYGLVLEQLIDRIVT